MHFDIFHFKQCILYFCLSYQKRSSCVHLKDFVRCLHHREGNVYATILSIHKFISGSPKHWSFVAPLGSQEQSSASSGQRVSHPLMNFA